MMPIRLIFAPFFAMGKLQSIELFLCRITLALQQFMFFAAPVLLIAFSLVLFKAFFQAITGQKNQEKKLTFVATLSWGIFAVLSFYLLLQIPLSRLTIFLFGFITIIFTLILPFFIALTYLYNLLFCCEETKCSRDPFSWHPPKLIVFLLLAYLVSNFYHLVTALKKHKLLPTGKKTSRIFSANKNFIVKSKEFNNK